MGTKYWREEIGWFLLVITGTILLQDGDLHANCQVSFFTADTLRYCFLQLMRLSMSLHLQGQGPGPGHRPHRGLNLVLRGTG